jgi:transcriptional regulator with XRE-family HTH domain
VGGVGPHHDLEARMDGRPMKVRRLEAGLSQLQLAEILGVHVRTVGRLETGERRGRRALRERIDQVLAERGLSAFSTPGMGL